MRIVVIASQTGIVKVYRFRDTADATGFAAEIQAYNRHVIKADEVHVLDPDDARHFDDPQEMLDAIERLQKGRA